MNSLPLLAAPTGGPLRAPQPGGWQYQVMQFLPLVLIFAVFYLVLIRPQQQRQKKLAQMVSNITKGDQVVTSGGIVGTVWAVKEDRVVVQVNDTRLDFVKSAIVSVTKPGS
ncbi:MAG TPA: preprotein translocase subunit YajC [Candidatus Saccharimonadales bacterium]|nr:preprotein translocase subunit YajC [Candidatus Saccharimonadales bacterium]